MIQYCIEQFIDTVLQNTIHLFAYVSLLERYVFRYFSQYRTIFEKCHAAQLYVPQQHTLHMPQKLSVQSLYMMTAVIL